MACCRGEFKVLEEAALEQGWSVQITKGNHVVFTSPTGTRIYASATPSDKRAFMNARAQMRRAGLVV